MCYYAQGKCTRLYRRSREVTRRLPARRKHDISRNLLRMGWVARETKIYSDRLNTYRMGEKHSATADFRGGAGAPCLLRGAPCLLARGVMWIKIPIDGKKIPDSAKNILGRFKLLGTGEIPPHDSGLAELFTMTLSKPSGSWRPLRTHNRPYRKKILETSVLIINASIIFLVLRQKWYSPES